jgi:hypothetical protein
MRILAVFLLVVLCGCESETTVIEGTLLDPEAATHVQVGDVGELAVVEAGTFTLGAIPGDSAELRFVKNGREIGTVQLNGLLGGHHLALEGIYFDEERGFPSTIEFEGKGPLVVNGLRMAAPHQLSETIATDGTLLASSSTGDAIVVRPLDEAMPDLRVVIVPATSVRRTDERPVSLRNLDFGDSLRVVGSVTDGYVIASEVLVSAPAEQPDEERESPADTRDLDPDDISQERENERGPSRSELDRQRRDQETLRELERLRKGKNKRS